jgi:cob(I)alamin adenosyltransferase
MTKKFKVYTKTGDDGSTGLVGGSRVKKYALRLEAYGTVDELNSLIGVIRSFKLSEFQGELLRKIQNKLFNIGSRLASDEKGNTFTEKLSITEDDTCILEKAIDRFEEVLPELQNFILPGGESVVAQCHVARTVCRRAERRIIELSEQADVQPELIKYINRLSDFLFVLARKIGYDRGNEETIWEY